MNETYRRFFIYEVIKFFFGFKIRNYIFFINNNHN